MFRLPFAGRRPCGDFPKVPRCGFAGTLSVSAATPQDCDSDGRRRQTVQRRSAVADQLRCVDPGCRWLVSLLAAQFREAGIEGRASSAPQPAHEVHRFGHAQYAGLPGDIEVKKLALLLAMAPWLHSQGLDPAALLKPPTNTWPSYNGDYTGRRYSTLSQVNQNNVGSLTMAWAFQTHQQAIKSTPLLVNGILYFTVPNHVWAVDARTGRQVWHFQRQSGGNMIGQRGVAMYRDKLYFGTPDAHLICLDARTGKQVWDLEIADYKFGYYISVTPLVVKDRLIMGMSNDQSDIPGFLEARNPEDGKVLWHWDAVPKPGEPGSETWPNADTMAHGGGATWIPGSYDPDLNLIYWGTGNPHPVLAGKVRRGANLYTCSIVALNADTGKMAWYFQASPHDTQDRDANESVVLIDANFKGRPRKLLAQASRNGYYFVLDRATGESLLSSEFGPQNWSAGLNARGEPIPKPDKEPQIAGALFEGSGTNWWSPSFSPTR